MNSAEFNMIKRYIKENLKKRFIKLSNALFTSLILLIRKLNKELQFYINYRDLNALIKKNKYLILRINEILRQLINVKFLIKMNIY